jgi:hypothetical protein
MIPLRPSPRRAPQALIRHVALFPRDDIPEEEEEEEEEEEKEEARDLPPSTAPPRLEQAQGQAQEE